MEYMMRCASTGAQILWLLRGCQTCKIPGSVWPANTKPAVWIIWWPHFLQWGSLPPFYTLLQAHKTSILAAKNNPNHPHSRYPATVPQQPHTAVLLHTTSVGKHHILSSFAQKPSNIHKTTLSKPILSPNDATSQWVSHFKVSSAWTATHSQVRSATLILTPIPGEASHPKNTIQGQAEIPASAAHGATAVLCSNTSGKMKLRTVYGRWMPLEKQKHETKRYNAAQVRWDANSWVRTWGLFWGFFSPFLLEFPEGDWQGGYGQSWCCSEELWRLRRSTERSPKETCTFPGGLLLHSKDSEGVPIWRILQALWLDAVL